MEEVAGPSRILQESIRDRLLRCDACPVVIVMDGQVECRPFLSSAPFDIQVCKGGGLHMQSHWAGLASLALLVLISSEKVSELSFPFSYGSIFDNRRDWS